MIRELIAERRPLRLSQADKFLDSTGIRPRSEHAA